eukprot:403377416
MKPPKFKQRTINSQFHEIQESIDFEKQSFKSDGKLLHQHAGQKKKFLKMKRDKATNALYYENDMEEDYLLTHLSEIIAQNKKKTVQIIDKKQPEKKQNSQSIKEVEIHKDFESIEQNSKLILSTNISDQEIQSSIQQAKASLEAIKNYEKVNDPSQLFSTDDALTVATNDGLRNQNQSINSQNINMSPEGEFPYPMGSQTQQMYEKYIHNQTNNHNYNISENDETITSKEVAIDISEFFDDPMDFDDDVMIKENTQLNNTQSMINGKPMTQQQTTIQMKQEIEQLKHKLKLRTKAITIIQDKVQTKQDLQKVAVELETMCEKNEQLQKTVDELLQENQVLGQIIDKMKSKVVTKSGVAVDELETAFIELNTEYEQLRQQNQQSYFHDQVRMTQESELQILRKQCENLSQDLHERDFRLNFLNNECQQTKEETFQLKERCEFYKVKFMDEAKELLRVRESFKQVVEDNKTHVQFIQVLEKRIRDLESQAQSDIEKLHKRLNELRLRTIQETAMMMQCQSNHDITNLSIIKAELAQEQSTNADLKQQLQLVAMSKDQIQASLAMCRHNLLQTTMKLDEEVRRVNAIEKMRLSELMGDLNIKSVFMQQTSINSY